MGRRVALLALLWAAAASAAHPQALSGVDTLIRPVSVARLHEIIREDSGRVVLLNVWATWCKWCKEEMPGILTLRRTLGPKGLSVILVSADDIDDLRGEVLPAARSLGITFPSYIMHDSTDEAFISGMSPTWNGALPTTFLFDRSGAMTEMLVGERTMKDLERRALLLLR
jgi:thiol-disulfide isomerase/thioredoxin